MSGGDWLGSFKKNLVPFFMYFFFLSSSVQLLSSPVFASIFPSSWITGTVTTTLQPPSSSASKTTPPLHLLLFFSPRLADQLLLSPPFLLTSWSHCSCFVLLLLHQRRTRKVQTPSSHRFPYQHRSLAANSPSPLHFFHLLTGSHRGSCILASLFR